MHSIQNEEWEVEEEWGGGGVGAERVCRNVCASVCECTAAKEGQKREAFREKWNETGRFIKGDERVFQK